MNIAFASDIHGEWAAFNRTLRLAREHFGRLPRMFIISGDVGPEPTVMSEDAYLSGLTSVLQLPLGYGADIVYWVPGNHDLPRPIPFLRGQACNLDQVSGFWDDRKSRLRLFGIGGGGPNKFGWSYEWSEEELTASLCQRVGDDWMALCDSAAPRRKACGRVCGSRDILVTHAPPKDILDEAPRGGGKTESVGSTTVRAFMYAIKPRLVLCGHIHEAMGFVRVGDTLVINAGSFGSPKVGQRVWLLNEEVIRWIDVEGNAGTQPLPL